MKVYRYAIFLLIPLLARTCDRAPENGAIADTSSSGERHVLEGRAMGTYMRITYLGDSIPALREQIDSLLEEYNLELSAWEPDSKLNAFNASESGVDLTGTRHFIPNLILARTIYAATDGAYDPTIAPLVNFWGFGTGEERQTADYDREEVDALLRLVGMDKVSLNGQYLSKSAPGVMLDLNASAKGYGVDLIAQYLADSGRPHHLVDIGGEMRSGGTKNGRPWNVAVRLPDEDRSKIASAGTLPLSDGRAIATSGNYEDYYRVGGTTFSHTINPSTGLVERNRLLGASVLAPDCATADAFATACMVLGPEKAMALIELRPELEGYFLVRADDGGLEPVKSSGL